MRRPVTIGDAVLHLDDCLDVLPRLAAGSVDAVVTDPPYGMRCKLDSTRFSGGNAPASRYRGGGRNDWPAVAGDDKPFDPAPWLDFPRVVLWGCNHFGAKLPRGTTLVWVKKADHLFGTFLSDCELAWVKGGHGVYAHRQQFPPSSRMKEGGGWSVPAPDAEAGRPDALVPGSGQGADRRHRARPVHG